MFARRHTEHTKHSGSKVPPVVVKASTDSYDRLTSDAGVGSSTHKSMKLVSVGITHVLTRPNTGALGGRRKHDQRYPDEIQAERTSDHMKETPMMGSRSVEFQVEFVKTAHRVARYWAIQLKERYDAKDV